MKIELKCPSCDSVLRVDAIHAGKQLRCPNCQYLTPIPLESPQTPFVSASDDGYSDFNRPMDDINETQPHYIQSNIPLRNEAASQETTSLFLGILGIVLSLGCGCFSPILFFVCMYGFYLALQSNGPKRGACLILNGIAMLICFCVCGYWLAILLA